MILPIALVILVTGFPDLRIEFEPNFETEGQCRAAAAQVIAQHPKVHLTFVCEVAA